MKTKNILYIAMLLFIGALLITPSTLMATEEAKTAESVTEMAGKAAELVEKLNINTASIESLANIPGIGPKIGEAIGAYREANGAFSSIADLVNVEGIDAGLLEKIKPFLTI